MMEPGLVERLRVGIHQIFFIGEMREPGKVVRTEVFGKHSPCRRIELVERIVGRYVPPPNLVIDGLDVPGICLQALEIRGDGIADERLVGPRRDVSSLPRQMSK